METFSFLWTIDNLSLQKHCVLKTTLLPIPTSQFSACIRLVYKKQSTHDLDFSINLNNKKYISSLNIYHVTTKKEKLQIYKSGTLPYDTANIDGSIEKNIFGYQSKEYKEADKLVFQFEVYYYVIGSNIGKNDSNLLSDMIQGFANLFNSKQCCDITLNVGDSAIKAHKAVLIARSPVFAAMFKHDMQEQSLNSVTITDIDANVIEEMLRYMYTDHTPNLEVMAEHLLEVAEKYELLSLKLKCEELLCKNICMENAVFTLMLADRLNATKLKQNILKYIAWQARGVMETEDWQKMVEDGINIHLVDAVFRAVVLKNSE